MVLSSAFVIQVNMLARTFFSPVIALLAFQMSFFNAGWLLGQLPFFQLGILEFSLFLAGSFMK